MIHDCQPDVLGLCVLLGLVLYDVLVARVLKDHALLGRRLATVLFVDFTDADNVVAAVTYARCQKQAGKTAHIVLTGSPIDFRRTRVNKAGRFKAPPRSKGSSGPEDQEEETEHVFDGASHVLAMAHETENVDDSHALLRVGAWLIRHALADAGLESGRDYHVYDGGVASHAGLSHAVMHHVEFFRSDARVSTPDEYDRFVAAVYDMDPCERRRIRHEAAVSAPNCHLDTLEQLDRRCQDCDVGVYVGGPFTAVSRFLQDGRASVRWMVAMACSWNGTANLLGDCFNNVVDRDAFKDVLRQQECGLFAKLRGQPSCMAGLLCLAIVAATSHALTALVASCLMAMSVMAISAIEGCDNFPIYFVPTETCKDPQGWLAASAADLEAAGLPSTVCRLVQLWSAINDRTGRDPSKPQTQFDVGPLMLAGYLRLDSAMPACGMPFDVVRVDLADSGKRFEMREQSAARRLFALQHARRGGDHHDSNVTAFLSRCFRK